MDVRRLAELSWKWLFCLDSRCAGMRRLGTGVFLMTNKYSQSYSRDWSRHRQGNGSNFWGGKLVTTAQQDRHLHFGYCSGSFCSGTMAADRRCYSQLFIKSEEIRGVIQSYELRIWCQLPEFVRCRCKCRQPAQWRSRAAHLPGCFPGIHANDISG